MLEILSKSQIYIYIYIYLHIYYYYIPSPFFSLPLPLPHFSTPFCWNSLMTSQCRGVMTVVEAVVSRPTPPECRKVPEEEQLNTEWWKVKKWATRVL